MSEDSEYVCTLDAASIKKAKDELNEIPEDRLAAVQAFRDWIKAQPHIQCGKMDTDFLLGFLRGCKFSQVRARAKFENQLKMKVEVPFAALDIDSCDPAMKAILDSGYIFPLPKRSPDGCLLIWGKAEAMTKLMGPMKVSVRNMLKFNALLLHYLERGDETTQVNGVKFIMDFSGLTLSTMTKYMSSETAKVEKMWMAASCARYKAFHYYRAGLFIDALMAFYKPFLPKKWIDRIKLHDTMESMYKDVPKECLPVEYLPDDYVGPNAGKTQDLIKAFAEEVTSPKVRNEILYLSSKAFWVDESKKPKETVTQHFRKLNIE